MMKVNEGEIKKVLGDNLIGSEELEKISFSLNIPKLSEISPIPPIPFDLSTLTKFKNDYILILGIPNDKKGNKLTINNLRSKFGADPDKNQPCFYNQDWYLHEPFAQNKSLSFRWYFIRKNIKVITKGVNPQQISKELTSREDFPSAILTVFTFFAYYFLTGGILWKHDFIWCSDFDNNGDRIYAGRYEDPKMVNKKGFNIHRLLAINKNYGLAPQLKERDNG